MSYRLPLLFIAIALLGISFFTASYHLPFDISLASSAPTLSDAGSGDMTLAGFVGHLADEGALAQIKGVVRQPFFSVPGTVVNVAGHDVQVYEYHATEIAYAEAGGVAVDGASVATDDGVTQIDWVARPHLYLRDRLIVVYVGYDEVVADVLSGTLGQPFAGAEAYGGMAVLIP